MRTIPKCDLIAGAVYVGEGRNFCLAIWDGENFQGVRNKFGSSYIDQEAYLDVENPEQRTASFKPYKLIITPEEACNTLKAT